MIFTRLFSGILFLITTSTVYTVSAQHFQCTQTKVKVAGASNMRMWEMKSQSGLTLADIDLSDPHQLKISFLKITVPVKTLKGHSPLMDYRAYKALKSYPNTQIKFDGKNFKMIGFDQGTSTFSCEGNLTIAGFTNILTVIFTAKINPDGSIICKGSKKLKMSDFDVRLSKVLVDDMAIPDEVTVYMDAMLLPVKGSVKQNLRE